MGSNAAKCTLKKCLAGFLCVWLSGIAFLICCSSSNAAWSREISCPLAKMKGGHHCDKSGGDAKTLFASAGRSDCLGECSILEFLFDRSRKTEPFAKLVTPSTRLADVDYRPVVKWTPRETLQTVEPIRYSRDTYL